MRGEGFRTLLSISAIPQVVDLLEICDVLEYIDGCYCASQVMGADCLLEDRNRSWTGVASFTAGPEGPDYAGGPRHEEL